MEDLGHAEVDDFGRGFAVLQCRQDIGWLDIPVHDALVMRMLEGPTERDEQSQPLVQVQLVSITILGDGNPMHEFHHEIGTPGLGRAGIEHPGDVRVIHDGEGLPQTLQGLLDPADDEPADALVDPVPEEALALRGFRW